MAVATDSRSAPVYVQQSFFWADRSGAPALAESATSVIPECNKIVAKEVVRPSIRPSSRPAVTVPTVRSSTSARRGRCEHVGGILASVLEKYGLGIDDLIAEIDSNR